MPLEDTCFLRHCLLHCFLFRSTERGLLAASQMACWLMRIAPVCHCLRMAKTAIQCQARQGSHYEERFLSM